ADRAPSGSQVTQAVARPERWSCVAPRYAPGVDAMRTGRRRDGLSGGRPLRIVALLSVLAFLSSVPSASAAGTDDVRRVLVLYPVNDGQPGVSFFDQSLRSTCKACSNQRIELYNEYLDAVRFPDDRYQRQLAEFLRQKYAGRKIDIVIPALARSLDFALK